jgi:hypothetical protein
MNWRLRPALAIPLCALSLAAIEAFASLLSEFIKRGSWEAAFSAWMYRRWEPLVILIGAATVIGLGLWGIQKAFSKKK